MRPAASRLTRIELFWASPSTDSEPEPGIKLAVIAIVVVLSRLMNQRGCAFLGRWLRWCFAQIRFWPASSMVRKRVSAAGGRRRRSEKSNAQVQAIGRKKQRNDQAGSADQSNR